jgi:hypothetical protein
MWIYIRIYKYGPNLCFDVILPPTSIADPKLSVVKKNVITLRKKEKLVEDAQNVRRIAWTL